MKLFAVGVFIMRGPSARSTHQHRVSVRCAYRQTQERRDNQGDDEGQERRLVAAGNISADKFAFLPSFDWLEATVIGGASMSSGCKPSSSRLRRMKINAGTTTDRKSENKPREAPKSSVSGFKNTLSEEECFKLSRNTAVVKAPPVEPARADEI
ncbi:MAG: hypothetical protein M3N35_08860 [Candidatus Binatota bacterium]|nr:hypothetical protein [Candidatus Binatota bacterium]